MADGSDAEQRRELIAYLQSVGFTDEQIAANGDSLLGLAARRVLFGDEKRVTVAEIAAMAGCDESLVRRVRLASGLPDVGDDAVCSPREAEVMTSFLLGAAVFGEEVTLQFLRVVGAATAGVAEAALATFASNRRAPLAEGGAQSRRHRARGCRSDGCVARGPAGTRRSAVGSLRERKRRSFRGCRSEPLVEVAVGFVDLVQSTQLTLSLSGEALARALSDFEANASDAVVGVGGRIVKRIGDAVMFVTSDAGGACAAALSILEAVAAHPQLNTARAAVTWGQVLPRDGDYFGAAVNLAARAVPLAEPGTIVVSAEVLENLDSDIWLATRTRRAVTQRLRRPRRPVPATSKWPGPERPGSARARVPAATRASISAGEKPQSARAVSVSTPAATGARCTSIGVRSKRGGSRLRCAVDLDEGAACDVVRMRTGFGHREHRREAHFVPGHVGDPLVARAGLEDVREAGLVLVPPLAIHLRLRAELFEAEPLEQVGVELRLVRPDRDPLAVGRLVHVVEVRAAVGESWCRAVPTFPSRRGRRRC